MNTCREAETRSDTPIQLNGMPPFVNGAESGHSITKTEWMIRKLASGIIEFAEPSVVNIE